MRSWPLLMAIPLLPLALLPLTARAEEPAKEEASLPFRTDSANAQLPWYQLKPSEFPPRGSEHRVNGELIAADFIHRCGQFRMASTGELADFKLLPCGVVRYLNADADLRDVPLGTSLQFCMYQDEAGKFTIAAQIEDTFSQLAATGVTYRLDAAHLPEGKLDAAPQHAAAAEKQEDLGHVELRVDDRTRVWKGAEQVKLSDLSPGDALLVNLCGTGASARCSDVWAGGEAQTRATTQQRERHNAFVKDRAVAGWIERVDGKQMTVTFFGTPEDVQALFKAQSVFPEKLMKNHERVRAVVANQELRSYNPHVDGENCFIKELRTVPTDRFGCSGISWVLEPYLMLEGFRKGRVIRVYANPSWPVHDMPFGEGLYTEVPNAKVEEESPNQYPFRTDFGNEELPWYQLKPGEFPPHNSQHTVAGELMKVDAEHRSGQFRTDRTGETVTFAMPPFASCLYHNAEADLGDLPVGAHYFFYLYQDDKGAFTRAARIIDDFTETVNDRELYRLGAADLDHGTLLLARHLPPMKNELDHLVQPPDLGHSLVDVDEHTRVWKGDVQVKLSDLAVGDELLIDRTGRTATRLGRCTEIWAGADAHKHAAEQQRERHAARLKEQGIPAWIDRVDGKNIEITLFSASRSDLASLLNGDPYGKTVQVTLVDEQLYPREGAPRKMSFKNRLPEANTVDSYGCSGIRWTLEAQQPSLYAQGQLIRVSPAGWKPAE